MLLLTQYSNTATGNTGPPTSTPAGNTQSTSLFMIAVCGFASAAASCRATDAREFR